MRFFILALSVWFPLHAATFYVATTGSDANTGSATSPFATIQRGLTFARAGDTVLVRPGTYGPNGSGSGAFPVVVNTAGTSTAPITIQSEVKWGAILDCQNTCYGYISLGANSAWIVIDGFNIIRGMSAAIHANSGGAKNVVVRNCHIDHIGNRVSTDPWGIVGIYTDQAAIMIVEYTTINDVGRTNDSGNSYDHGIYYHGNLTIRYCVFYNSRSGWHIQTAAGFQGQIAYNTFDGPDMYPGKYGQIMLWETAGGPLNINHNIFSNPGGAPITYWQTSIASCTVDTNFTTAATMSDYAGCKSVNQVLNTLPKFVAPPDYHLQTGSPAAGYGAFPVPVNPPLITCVEKWTGPGGTPMTTTWLKASCP